MSIEQYAKKWPRAYQWVTAVLEPYKGLDRASVINERYEPVWPDDAPPPTDEMIEQGAIYLGRGRPRRNPPLFHGWLGDWFKWHKGRCVGVTDSHFALDPSGPNADAIIREFRPDLIDDHEQGTEFVHNEHRANIPYPIVRIVWRDSYGCAPDWSPLSNAQEQIHLCVSIGFLVLDGQDVKVVVPHMSPANESIGAEEQGCGDMAIPTASISHLEYL